MKRKDNGWLFELCYRRGYSLGYIEGYEACRKDLITIMKRTFCWVALMIAAFLMLVASPSSVETWGELCRWIFCKVMLVSVFFLGTMAFETYE